MFSSFLLKLMYGVVGRLFYLFFNPCWWYKYAIFLNATRISAFLQANCKSAMKDTSGYVAPFIYLSLFVCTSFKVHFGCESLPHNNPAGSLQFSRSKQLGDSRLIPAGGVFSLMRLTLAAMKEARPISMRRFRRRVSESKQRGGGERRRGTPSAGIPTRPDPMISPVRFE